METKTQNSHTQAVASKLASNGFHVALGSRSESVSIESKSMTSIKVDVSKPAQVSAAFQEVERTFGAPANVVIYNVAAFSSLPNKGEPFSLPYEQFTSDFTAGALGAYSTLQHTVEAFKRVEDDKPKVFIATSNFLGTSQKPSIAYFGVGSQKRTLAYYVQGANEAYGASRGFRFYLAAQVDALGRAPSESEFSGEAHAIAYWTLIQKPREAGGAWDVRFNKEGSILVKN